MNTIQPKKMRIGFKLLYLLIGVMLSATLFTSRVYAVLPPRPTVQPPHAKTTPTPPRVAPIVLHTSPAQSGLWSVVQWQDAQGGWHDVESWRGAVSNGQTIWWVEEKDFGKGPFRWVVFQADGGKQLAISTVFTLPSQPRQPLNVAVALQ